MCSRIFLTHHIWVSTVSICVLDLFVFHASDQTGLHSQRRDHEGAAGHRRQSERVGEERSGAGDEAPQLRGRCDDKHANTKRASSLIRGDWEASDWEDGVYVGLTVRVCVCLCVRGWRWLSHGRAHGRVVQLDQEQAGGHAPGVWTGLHVSTHAQTHTHT